MATPSDGNFELWLTDKLHSVSSDIDTDVFVSYIIGILDTESPAGENEESITELLSGVIEPDLAKDVCRAIVGQWDMDMDSRRIAEVTEDVGDKLSRIIERQTLATVKEKKLSKEEADRKAAILAQYGQVSDGDESDPCELSEDENPTSSGGSMTPASGGSVNKTVRGDTQDFTDNLLIRNVNKEEVQRVEREKREKAKEEQEKKKEKDKQDRLVQKQKQQERKETEKKRTQKGEKRR